MDLRRRYLIIPGAILAIAIAGAGVAAATGGGDDGDATVTGAAADRATAAALEVVHGTANSVERDSENGATWEVEVTKPNGSTVDVRLDQDFHPVVVEDDSETSDGGGVGDSG
jgi:hypothetical protein